MPRQARLDAPGRLHHILHRLFDRVFLLTTEHSVSSQTAIVQVSNIRSYEYEPFVPSGQRRSAIFSRTLREYFDGQGLQRAPERRRIFLPKPYGTVVWHVPWEERNSETLLSSKSCSNPTLRTTTIAGITTWKGSLRLNAGSKPKESRLSAATQLRIFRK